MDRNELARGFIALMGELGEVLRAEVDCVRGMRIAALRELQEPKARLVVAYADSCAAMTANPASLSELRQDVKDRLREAVADLKAVAAEDALALEAARQVNERMLRAIAEFSARAGNPVRLYARNGREQHADAGVNPAAPPLTLDRIA
jgi:hypothetical protein